MTLAAASQRQHHVPVEPGFWVMIFADMTVFATLFAAFVVRRHESPDTFAAFAAGAAELDKGIGLANTFVLLTSSLFVARAVVLFRSGAPSRARTNIISGLVLGIVFVGLKTVEYTQKIAAGITVSTSRFFEFYFSFTGLHLLHVVIGIGLLGFLCARGRDPEWAGTAVVEGVGCYWHMVDLLWLMLFSLFYLVP